MWLKFIWHSRLPFSVVVGVSLTDLKWVGFSGSGTGWGICFMGTGLVHPLLEQNEQCSVIVIEQSLYKYSIKRSPILKWALMTCRIFLMFALPGTHDFLFWVADWCSLRLVLIRESRESSLWNPLTLAYHLLSPCTAIYWVYFNTNTVSMGRVTK